MQATQHTGVLEKLPPSPAQMGLSYWIQLLVLSVQQDKMHYLLSVYHD
jgi:hypothetical protein